MIEGDTIPEGIQEMNLHVDVFECNNVENLREWWVDIGATHDFVQTMFSNYKKLIGEQLLMGNSKSSKLKDK